MMKCKHAYIYIILYTITYIIPYTYISYYFFFDHWSIKTYQAKNTISPPSPTMEDHRTSSWFPLKFRIPTVLPPIFKSFLHKGQDDALTNHLRKLRKKQLLVGLVKMGKLWSAQPKPILVYLCGSTLFPIVGYFWWFLTIFVSHMWRITITKRKLTLMKLHRSAIACCGATNLNLWTITTFHLWPIQCPSPSLLQAGHRSMHLAWKTCVQSKTLQMSTPTWKACRRFQATC